MPSIRTRFFGVVECAPEDIITFPAGIPPFAGSTHFVIMSDEPKRPLLFLQSADEHDLCFITIPIRGVDAGYEIAAEPHDLNVIQWGAERQPALDDLLTLAILTVPESGTVTANLLAPVLIDAKARLGVQAVRADGRYTHAHELEQSVATGEATC